MEAHSDEERHKDVRSGLESFWKVFECLPRLANLPEKANSAAADFNKVENSPKGVPTTADILTNIDHPYAA